MSNTVARPTRGYLMVPATSPPPHDGHILGGAQNIAGAVSPNSGRRLLQLAQINTADRRLELQAADFEMLPLLYSWTCDMHQGSFTYRVRPGSVELLDFQQGRAHTDFPYAGYPDAFAPQFMDLAPIDANDQKIILELNDRSARRSCGTGT